MDIALMTIGGEDHAALCCMHEEGPVALQPTSAGR
jgi:hypothetical protein